MTDRTGSYPTPRWARRVEVGAWGVVMTMLLAATPWAFDAARTGPVDEVNNRPPVTFTIEEGGR